MDRQELKEWVGVILTAIAIVVLLRVFIIDNRVVPTPSMVPSIECGDRLFVEKVTHRFKGLNRGEVIVFAPPEASGLTDDLIKRLIGLPGDTVEIRDGQLYVNDKVVQEPYLAEPIENDFAKVTVPPGKIFVLGDNRNHSFDSEEWGFADVDSVKGKAFYTYWPLNRMKYWK